MYPCIELSFKKIGVWGIPSGYNTSFGACILVFEPCEPHPSIYLVKKKKNSRTKLLNQLYSTFSLLFSCHFGKIENTEPGWKITINLLFFPSIFLLCQMIEYINSFFHFLSTIFHPLTFLPSKCTLKELWLKEIKMNFQPG